MRFLFQGNRDTNIFIHIAFSVCKLFRWASRVTFKYNFVVVSFFHELAKVEIFIDIEGLRLRELGQALLVVRVEGTRVDEQAL